MTMRFHYRTDDAIIVTASDPLGAVISDAVTIVAGLGTAYRPPIEASLLPCSWLTAAGPERAFALPLKPATQGIVSGVYRVWFRLSVPPLSPLVVVEEPIVIYGGP